MRLLPTHAVIAIVVARGMMACTEGVTPDCTTDPSVCSPITGDAGPAGDGAPGATDATTSDTSTSKDAASDSSSSSDAADASADG